MRRIGHRWCGALLATVLISAGGGLLGCTERGRPTPSPIPAPQSDGSSLAPGGPTEAPARSASTSIAVTVTHSVVRGAIRDDRVPVSVTMTTPDGRPIATGSPRIRDGGWRALLQDDRQRDAPVREGHELWVYWPGGETDGPHRIPETTLRFDRASGAVSGRTAPGSRIALTRTRSSRTATEPEAAYSTPPPEPMTGALPAEPAGPTARPERPSSRTDAGTDGEFALPPLDGGLSGGSEVALTVRDGRLRIGIERLVPYVRASLHPGDVTGAARPSSPVTVTLTGGDGNVLGEGFGETGTLGRFSVWIREEGRAGGERIRPSPGDTVTVVDTESERSFQIPALDAQHDLGRNEIVGRAAPESGIQITVWNPWFPGEVDEPMTQVDGDGQWRLSTDVELHPASHYYVTERVAPGDQAYYCYQVPMLHLGPGTAFLQVEALWEVRAQLALLRNGATVARAEGGGRWSGDLGLVMRDDRGNPVRMQPGDIVSGTVDDRPIRLTVPPLTATLEAAAFEVIARGAPGTRLHLGRSGPLDVEGTTDAEGSVRLTVPGEPPILRPEERLQVYQVLDGGHHARVLFQAPSLTLSIPPDGATARIRGDGMPGDRMTLSRRGPLSDPAGAGDGRESITIPVGASGRFDQRLDAVPRPGALIELTASQPLTVTVPLTVPTLAARVEGDVVRGQGPPDDVLSLFLLPDGARVTELRTIATDERGRWSFDVSEDIEFQGVSALSAITVSHSLGPASVDRGIALDRR